MPELQKRTKRTGLPKSFIYIWGSSALASFGDYVFETTLVLWIVTSLADSEPWVAQAVSGVYLASAIPTLLLGTFAGVFVDRRDARRASMQASSLSALIIGVLAVVSMSSSREAFGLEGTPLLVSLYVVTGIAAALALVMRPAISVLVKDVLPRDDIVRAASYTNVTSNIIMLLGPAIASVLFFQFGATIGLAVNAFSYVGAFLLVSLIPAGVSKSRDLVQGTVWEDTKQGFGYFLTSRPVMALAVGMSIMVFAAGIINSLSIFFLTNNLQASEELFGLFASFQAAGMLIGAAVSVFVVSRMRIERVFWMSLVGIGVSICVFSRQTSYVPGVMSILVVGLFVSVIPLAIGPITMLSTPRELLGRVGSVLNVVLSLGTVVGLGAGGFLYGSVFDGLEFSFLSLEFETLSFIFGMCGVLCIMAGLIARRMMTMSSGELTSSE